MRVLNIAILVLLILLAGGTAGYVLIEGWETIDGLYMTLITLTTIGFGEVRPLSPAGKLFTMILILFGVGTAAAVWSSATRFITEGSLRDVLGRNKMEKKVSRLQNHYIICGYGRMGKLIAAELSRNNVSFVVLEKDETLVNSLTAEGVLSIMGDATDDTVLAHCGIERATGLVAVLKSDADNVYVTLSARGMSSSLFIVSRAADDNSEGKLKRAGADRVVLPYTIGGMKIAQAILRPTILEFIDQVGGGRAQDLMLDEVHVDADSPYVDLPLNESNIRQQLGVIILAIKPAGGAMQINPRADQVIRNGDTLICLGARKILDNT
jgi:voltage-gated potassium channel